MSRKVGEVSVEFITTVNDVCMKPCCTKYFLRVLGKDIEVSREDADAIIRRMRSEDSFYLHDRYPFQRKTVPVRLSLVLD